MSRRCCAGEARPPGRARRFCRAAAALLPGGGVRPGHSARRRGAPAHVPGRLDRRGERGGGGRLAPPPPAAPFLTLAGKSARTPGRRMHVLPPRRRAPEVRMTTCERIAAYVQRAQWDAISPEARDKLKQHLLDALGCALGAVMSPVIAATRREERSGGCFGPCSRIACGTSTPERAAFHNAAL